MRATVVLPTLGTSPTLGRVIDRVLAQSVQELELFVVGDGVPDDARGLVESKVAADRRIRLFDFPKGPRRGELHRHEALRAARGRIVCYVTDDDLWLPEHVEEMERLLDRGVEFAHGPSIVVMPGGTVGNVYAVDHALEADRRMTLEGWPRVHLSCAGHTLALYRRLPHGWRTTPEGVYTDHYMWQQVLSLPSCRAASGTRPTVLCFPTKARAGWTAAELEGEFDRWARRVDDPRLREAFLLELIGWLVADRARTTLPDRLRQWRRQRLAALARRFPGLNRAARAE